MSQPIRILLSEQSSRHLDAVGGDAFTIIAKDRSDERSGRWVLHLAPCPLATAREAEGVIHGTHRAVRIKKPSIPSQS